MMKVSEIKFGWVVAIALILLVAIAAFSTKQEEQTPITHSNTVKNQWVSQYAGDYVIEVSGVNANLSTEAYILKSDGSAKWLWIVNDGNNGAVIKDKDYGTWSASSGHISVSINGNSGTITEEYTMTNGRFVNDASPRRYLKINQRP